MPVVLFILGGVGTRIIPQDHHHAADDIHVVELHKGVRRHIEPDAFKKYRCQVPVDRSAVGDLRGHLLVGGKLEIKGSFLRRDGLDGRGNLRRGRSRIGCHHTGTRFDHGPDQSGIAHDDLRERVAGEQHFPEVFHGRSPF